MSENFDLEYERTVRKENQNLTAFKFLNDNLQKDISRKKKESELKQNNISNISPKYDEHKSELSSQNNLLLSKQSSSFNYLNEYNKKENNDINTNIVEKNKYEKLTKKKKKLNKEKHNLYEELNNFNNLIAENSLENKENKNTKSNEKKSTQNQKSKMLKTFYKLNTIKTIQRKKSPKKKDESEKNNNEEIRKSNEIRELLKSEGNISKNIKSLNKERKINDTIVAVMTFLGIILCFLQLFNLISNNYENSSIVLTLRACILILSIPNLIFIYRRINIDIDIRKYHLKLRESTLWSSGYYKYFFIEIFLNIIQPFPYLEFTFKYNNGNNYIVKLSFSHICTIFMVVRIYLTFKLLNYYTVWTNARSKRIGKLQGIEIDYKFALKVLLKKSPIRILIIVSIFFVLFFSLLLKGFENFDPNDKENSFRFFWNSIWINIITMTTVGFGDISPLTNIGKIFCILTCLMGNFLLGMLVAVLSIHVYFDSDELKVYRKLIEKDIIFTEIPLELKEVFTLLGDMIKKKMYLHNDEMFTSEKNIKILEKLLLRFKIKKLIEKKKNVIIEEDESIEQVVEKLDRELDVNFIECSNKTITIIKNEKKLFEIANYYPNVATKIFDSKDYANRITNLANLMRVIGICGKIQNINDIEGGRLFTRKELIEYQRYFFLESIYNKQRMERILKNKADNIEKNFGILKAKSVN